MIEKRVPLRDPESLPIVQHCTNRFCQKVLKPDRFLVYRGYGYCSRNCKKLWPPVIPKIQVEYNMPIEVVVAVSITLFKSKKRAADVLGISTMTLEKLLNSVYKQTKKHNIKN